MSYNTHPTESEIIVEHTVDGRNPAPPEMYKKDV